MSPGGPRLRIPVDVPSPRIPAFLRGPRLQVANLAVFYAVAYGTVDFPNPPLKVAASVAAAVAAEALLTRARGASWTLPWGAIIGTAAAWLVLDGFGWAPFLALPLLVVLARQLTWDGDQLFNANNLAMSLLLVAGPPLLAAGNRATSLLLEAGQVRVGVTDWGAAPQVLLLIVLFGAISTSRVNRLDVAVLYLGFSSAVYFVVASVMGWGLPTVWLWALNPLQVMLGFFAVTDPAVCPGSGLAKKAAWALLIVLLGVPATLAGFVEAPIFALLAAAPQRRFLFDGVERLQNAVRRWRQQPHPATGLIRGGRR